MIIMLVIVGGLFALIFGYKIFKNMMIGRWMASHGAPVVYVSVIEATHSKWQPQLKASGSVRAILGVNITTEMAGMIRDIHFKPGAMVKKGELLVQLDIDADLAQLHVYEANAALASITYKRDKSQYAFKAISKATLDSDEANLKSTEAQVAQQKAMIQKKTIRAPFSGHLGISAVNPGQYLNPGDKVTMLQTLDPVYVDFYVPQQSISTVKVGQKVNVTVDSIPGKLFPGKITTVDPGVDAAVRNVQVEATLPNALLALTPGMFVSVAVDTGGAVDHLTLPQTAITFNPYGETVFIVKEKEKDAKGQPVLMVTQSFVKTGEKRGDQVVILTGVKEGDKVVTGGQLKLKNGSIVAINNNVLPVNETAPQPVDET